MVKKGLNGRFFICFSERLGFCSGVTIGFGVFQTLRGEHIKVSILATDFTDFTDFFAFLCIFV